MAGNNPTTVSPEVPAGNVYDKYGSRNPIERMMVAGFIARITEAVRLTGARTVLEAGCGEGYVSGGLASEPDRARFFAFDLDAKVVAAAKADYPQVGFFISSVYDMPFSDGSVDLLIACEVLEHLEEPEKALKEMARVTRGYALVSVPREPLWRILNMMRLKYIGRLGNTPGHVRHWSKGGILKLLSGWFDIVAVSSPLPWTVCLCRKKK
jgi:2-polyprenyl-3-methyl-5-hydroxy-6-metoxy-1,4-benzoquinol methylase